MNEVRKRMIYIIIPTITLIIFMIAVVVLLSGPLALILAILLAISIVANGIYQSYQLDKFEDKYLPKKVEKRIEMKYGVKKVVDLQFMIYFILGLGLINLVGGAIRGYDLEDFILAGIAVIIAGSLWLYKKFYKK
jgi:hypothetical protein